MKDMKVAGSLISFVFVASHAGTTEEGDGGPDGGPGCFGKGEQIF